MGCLNAFSGADRQDIRDCQDHGWAENAWLKALGVDPQDESRLIGRLILRAGIAHILVHYSGVINQ